MEFSKWYANNILMFNKTEIELFKNVEKELRELALAVLDLSGLRNILILQEIYDSIE